MKASVRNLGFSGFLLFGCLTMFALIVWWTVPAKNHDPILFVIAAFVLGTVLSCYLVLLQNRYRLFFDDSVVRQSGIVFENQLDMNSVDELKWRCFPKGGSVVIAGRTDSLKIELGNFEPADRHNIIQFFRQSIEESKQVGQQKFDEEFSDTPAKKKIANRNSLLMIFFFAVHAVAFGTIWAFGAGVVFLFFSGLNALMVATLLRWRRQRKTRYGDSDGEPGDAPQS